MRTNPPDALGVGIIEAARRLGVGRSTIYNLIAAGDLSVVKLGARSIIPTADISELVERLAVRATSLKVAA